LINHLEDPSPLLNPRDHHRAVRGIFTNNEISL
jgi:hypothetical protein